MTETTEDVEAPVQAPVINLETIADETVLKAMAYDRIEVQEQARRELDAINQRIAQVRSQPQTNGVQPNRAQRRGTGRGRATPKSS